MPPSPVNKRLINKLKETRIISFLTKRIKKRALSAPTASICPLYAMKKKEVLTSELKKIVITETLYRTLSAATRFICDPNA
jgi:hypothetical protein